MVLVKIKHKWKREKDWKLGAEVNKVEDHWGNFVVLKKTDDADEMLRHITASIKELMKSFRKALETREYIEGSGEIIIKDSTDDYFGKNYYTVGCKFSTRREGNETRR